MAPVRTTTLCPQCLRRVDGDLVRRGDEVWLRRICPEHGEAEALVWRGAPAFADWTAAGAGTPRPASAPSPTCPSECGLCAAHLRQTCCILLEVTGRCDLMCPVCFAAAGGETADPSLTTIEGWYRRLLEVAPGCNVQLSGGEPTVRDDLPEVVALGRDLGHGFIQLNTNGLRLAREDGYADALAAAGLGTVFLQFDGVDDAPYEALRGRPLAALKKEAVLRCAEAGLGVVLVPTVVRGVNLDRLGAVLEFALEHAPAVRGVHLQPMALLGRYTAAGDVGATRVTLPDAMRALAEQSDGRVRLEDLTPGNCEHPLCSCSREYLRQDDGSLTPLGAPREACGCGAPEVRPAVAPTEKAAHVAARWAARRSASVVSSGGCCVAPEEGGARARAGDPWDAVLDDVHARTFSVSGMAFMDAWTADLDRLRQCYLHVLAPDGRVVPFCAYNLTDAQGGGLPSGRQGATIGDPERAAQRAGAERITSGPHAPEEDARRPAGCMVCGADLVYRPVETPAVCHYCGRVGPSRAACSDGHFVCDACHRASAVEIIERVCLSSRATDAVALMQHIRAHPGFPLHGPEHHSLVPAVILTALKNGGAAVTDEIILAAIRRGETVAGGACAYLGACGAAVGVGIALSLLTGADPLDGEARQAVQRATAAALEAVASYAAPRCCQRDAWLAVRVAAALLPGSAGLTLEADADLTCRQWRANAECIREDCPLWPAARPGRSRLRGVIQAGAETA